MQKHNLHLDLINFDWERKRENGNSIVSQLWFSWRLYKLIWMEIMFNSNYMDSIWESLISKLQYVYFCIQGERAEISFKIFNANLLTYGSWIDPQNWNRNWNDTNGVNYFVFRSDESPIAILMKWHLAHG